MAAGLLGFAAALGLGGPVLAGEGAAFLGILPGARPMAMAGAYTAVADDLNSLGSNPSGLSRLGYRQAAFMHAELFAGNRYDFLGYAQPLKGRGTLGLGMTRLSYGKLEGRGADGKATGSFGAADTAVSLAYGQKIPGRAELLGANLKYVETRLAEASARTAALDLGVMRPYALRGLPLMLGAAVKNLGPGLRLGEERSQLPLAVSLGVSLRLGGTAIVSADIEQRPYSGGLAFGVGSEYALLPAFALRAGYAGAPGAGGAGAGNLSGLGMGFGLKFLKASLDYSFSPYGELGNAQRISLATRF